MTLYLPYFIYIAISFLSFIFFNLRKRGKDKKKTRNIWLISIILTTIVLYFSIKLILGWRLNWYIEAIIVLGVSVIFDYLILLKKKYTKNLKEIYSILRLFSFGIPIIYTLGCFFIALISFGYGGFYECVSIPKDRSYEEQHIHKNLYIYFDECSQDLSFKKKFVLFEKDVASVYSRDARAAYWNNHQPITGHISYRNDTIIITSKKEMPKNKEHIRLIKLPKNKIQIEKVVPISYPPEPGKEIETETYKIKTITL